MGGNHDSSDHSLGNWRHRRLARRPARAGHRLRPAWRYCRRHRGCHDHQLAVSEARYRSHVEFATPELEAALDALLQQYEGDFDLRHPFFLARYMDNDVQKDARFIGGVVESADWSYLFETSMIIRQYLAPPTGVQIQVPPGTVPPLIPGLPRRYEWQLTDQGWRRNVSPKGVTA
jgi:hypothetical protein